MTEILSETKTSLRVTAPDIAHGYHKGSSTGDGADNLDQLIEELNNSVRPPQELDANDVVNRTMYLVSDQVNQYYGKFDLSELEKIARLCVDAPVLIGHRKDKLPIGRIFKAQLVKRDGAHWVKVYFYWLKDVKDSETMVGNIDGGIYKECSLGFVYTKAECVKCGNDIRECGHHIFNQSELNSDSQNAEPLFYYKGTQRILEISLVYRGATHNTKISKDLWLGFADSDPNEQLPKPENPPSPEKNTDWLSELSIRRERIILSSQKRLNESEYKNKYNTKQARTLPLYDGLALVLVRQNSALTVMRDDLTKAPDLLCEYIQKHIELPECDCAIYGRLVGMRGKERRSISDLVRFLRDEGGSVRYAKFYALATLYHQGQAVSSAEEMATTEIFTGSEKKSRYLSWPQAFNLLNNAAKESCETISVHGEGKFVITRMSYAIEFTHTLTESEVAHGIATIKPAEEHGGPDLHIQLENCESWRGRANTNVLIRGAGAESRNGAVHLINPRIVANLYDYVYPEDALNYDSLVKEILSESAALPTPAPGLALYERVAQPGMLVRASAYDLAYLAGNERAEITLGAGVSGRKPFRARIIRLLNSDKSELALLRVNDDLDNQLAVAA